MITGLTGEMKWGAGHSLVDGELGADRADWRRPVDCYDVRVRLEYHTGEVLEGLHPMFVDSRRVLLKILDQLAPGEAFQLAHEDNSLLGQAVRDAKALLPSLQMMAAGALGRLYEQQKLVLRSEQEPE